MVAEVNNKAVGIILGKNKEKYRCSPEYLFRGVSALTQLLFLKEGRQILYFYQDVGRIDKLLLKKCPQHYKCRGSSVCPAPEYRGLESADNYFTA